MLSVLYIQQALGITGQDDIIAALEAAAVADLERWTNRLYTSPVGPMVETLDVDGREHVPHLRHRAHPPLSLFLDEEPVGAVLTEVIKRSSISEDWSDPLDLTNFELYDRTVIVKPAEHICAGTRTVQLTYDFGWAEDAGLPNAMQLVVDMTKAQLDAAAFETGLKRDRMDGIGEVEYYQTGGVYAVPGFDSRVRALKRPVLP